MMRVRERSISRQRLLGRRDPLLVRSAVDGCVSVRDRCCRVAEAIRGSGNIANKNRHPFTYSSAKIEHLYGTALHCYAHLCQRGKEWWEGKGREEEGDGKGKEGWGVGGGKEEG